MPKFRVIDFHTHLGQGRETLSTDQVAGYLAEMDASGVKMVINLDGGWGDRLRETVAALDEAHPGRFLTFARINYTGIDEDGWSKREAASLEQGFRDGAKGLKISKRLGLYAHYADGRLVPVDDPKLDPIWEVCGRYGRPILIHVSDPAAFFTPLDRFNERWHQLMTHPNWMFHGDGFPSRDEILEQRNRVIARHPKTTFVCAHAGNNPEHLVSVGRLLDKFPNMFIEISARINELGRQPYTTRRFFIQYQDRVLYGTDGKPERARHWRHYRFLETDDEYFSSSADQPRHRFWPIYGVFLPDEVLEKIYATNAERVLGQKPKETDEWHLTRRATEWMTHLESVIHDDNKPALIETLVDYLVPSKQRANTADFYYDHWKTKPELHSTKVEKVEIAGAVAKVYFFHEWEKKDGTGIQEDRETLDFIRTGGEWYRNREITDNSEVR